MHAGGWRRRTRWRGHRGLVKALTIEAVMMTVTKRRSRLKVAKTFLVSRGLINLWLNFACFKVKSFISMLRLSVICIVHYFRSTVCRPAERSRGLWPARVWCFWLWTEAAVSTWGQWSKLKHRSPTWAPHTQSRPTAQKREIVPGLPQTHISPTPNQLLLP